MPIYVDGRLHEGVFPNCARCEYFTLPSPAHSTNQNQPMISSPCSLFRRAAALLLALGSFVGIAQLNAQVFLTFSGGSGTQVTVSWT